MKADEMIVAVEIPHQRPVRVFQTTPEGIRALADLKVRELIEIGNTDAYGLSEAYDIVVDDDWDASKLDIDTCAAILAYDLADMDIWSAHDIGTLAARIPSASRHGDPERTTLALACARKCGLLPAAAEEDGNDHAE